MNQAKTLIAAGVVAACAAWPLAGSAQTGGSSPGYGTTGSPGPGTTRSPSAATPASGGAAAVNSTDSNFVAMAASGGMLEVQASRLALEKSQSGEIRSFAQRMIDDHDRANSELMTAARGAGITDVPAALSPRHQAMLDRLRALGGAEFDRQYAEQIGLNAHHETVALFQREASDGSNPALKSFAAKALPTLRGHLQQSQTVASAVGVPMDRMQAYAPTLGNTSGSAAAATAGTASAGSASYRSPSAGDSTTGQAGAWTGSGLVGPYVGGSVGQSNYSSDNCVGQCDKTRFAGKVFGGYMFTPWIGAEVDYGWYGTAKINANVPFGSGLVNTTADVQADGFSGFLVGQYPIDQYRVFGKLGFSRLNTQVNGSVNGIQVIDNNDASFEFAWGVGAAYMFDRNLGVRVEYEARKYTFEGDKNTLGLWSVGVQYHF